jgi:hypothetical protein
MMLQYSLECHYLHKSVVFAKYVFGFAKQTKNQPKQNEFRFGSVQTEIFFVCIEDTLGKA